jgi:DNA-binding response OmpR family regulator
MAQSTEVLVVEDDAALNGVICRFVQAAGFTTRSALDGNSALREVRERTPSIILLDLMLPDTSGFDICEELKKDEKTSSVPVVMVTALNDDESRERGFTVGAIAYLTKPFDPDQLIDVIRLHSAA